MTPRSSRRIRSAAAVTALVLAGCGDNAGDAVETTVGTTVGTEVQDSATVENPSATTDDEMPAGCRQPPSVSVTAAGATMSMAMVFYGESTESCGLDMDGGAMFNSSFRPEQVLVAPDRTAKVTVDADGDVVQDVRLFEPTTAVAGIKPAIALTAESDGSYSVTLPGAGCFIVTIGWQADGRRGQFTSLAETAPGSCSS